jgi:hypothetical protein
LIDDRDRRYFGQGSREEEDKIGFLDTRAIFDRSYAAEPDILVEQIYRGVGRDRGQTSPRALET